MKKASGGSTRSWDYSMPSIDSPRGESVDGVHRPSQPLVPGATVLVVDDDRAFRVALTRQLTRAGYVVVDAASADAALAAVQSTVFDLLITDVNMPHVGGLELLRLVRERDALVSIVLITGEPNAAAAASAAALGAMHYLIKPVATPQMLEIAGRAARLTRLARLQRASGSMAGGDDADDRTLRLGRDAQLSQALRTLWLAHQPIVHTEDHSLAGYEVLMRFDDPTIAGPPALLALAEECGRLPAVGRTVRQFAARSPVLMQPDVLLFVNLHASDLNDPTLTAPEAPLSKVASRIVLEITERASLESVPNVDVVVRRLRELGYRLAVDDLGAGYSGLSSLTLLEPEVVKLDMSLVRDIDTSVAKRRIVAGLIALARELGMVVVSEGVETTAERDVLAELGSTLLQGYYLGRPERVATAPAPRIG